MRMANTTRLLIAFVGFFCCSIEAAKTPPTKPNFILIMADNLGYGDIGGVLQGAGGRTTLAP